MRACVELDSGSGGVLLLSMREMADQVGYCALYEFEDVIADATGADVARPTSFETLESFRRVYKLARYATGSARLAGAIAPRPRAVVLEKDYELFMPVFNHPYELYALNAVKDWRRRCRLAVCYLCEAWEAQLPGYLFELLRDFDHVFIGVHATTESVGRICRRPCSYVPMGVDALRFCPYPDLPARSIDVCGIGRRSPVTHAALLEWARRTGSFYFYDTIQARVRRGSTRHITFRVGDVREHRLLFANLLRRSRYFIANRAWADAQELTRGRDAIAARFYEGAAAGAIMLGDPPDSADFRAQFDWEDAVVPVPFHAPRMAETIAALDADPARRSRIRRRNVFNALRRHDWVYRLRAICAAAGMAPTPGMLAREARLSALAAEVQAADAA